MTFQEELSILRDQLDEEANLQIEYQDLAITKHQLTALNALIGKFFKESFLVPDRNAKLAMLSFVLDKDIRSTNELSKWEATCLINKIKEDWDPVNGSDPWEVSSTGRQFFTDCLEASALGRSYPRSAPTAATRHSTQSSEPEEWPTDLPDLQPPPDW